MAMLVPAERIGSADFPHMARRHLHFALPAGVELLAVQETTAYLNRLTGFSNTKTKNDLPYIGLHPAETMLIAGRSPTCKESLFLRTCS